jgi:hypothetical protein
MGEMVVPEWVDGVRDEMIKQHQETPLDPSSFKMQEWPHVSGFSTLFAEFEVREKDLLVHLFPRNGPEDVWEKGHYINRCRSCSSEVPQPKSVTELQPCERCGHTGLQYIPGRTEEASSIAFPDNMSELIKDAADKVWVGDIAAELIPELNAYIIQFQGAKNTVNTMGPAKFVDKFCEEIDALLDSSLQVQ